MSLSAGSTKNIIAGDGMTTVFGYTVPILTSDGSDLFLFVVDNIGNVTSLTGNYSVNVATSQITYPLAGGISPLAPGVNYLPVGWQLVVMRIEALSQLLVLTAQGTFDAASIMSAVDKVTAICQQLQEQLNRCVMVPINVPGGSSPVIAPSVTVLPTYTGTYLQIKALAAANPTQLAWGFASDLNGGQGQVCYYTANALVGDAGWILMPTGMIGG